MIFHAYLITLADKVTNVKSRKQIKKLMDNIDILTHTHKLFEYNYPYLHINANSKFSNLPP